MFVDTNVPIDVATGNPTWAEWSRHAIASAHARGPLLINAIVYTEFAIGFGAQSDCGAEIETFDLTLAEIPKSAAFRAAQAFRFYRRAGGTRRVALPDVFTERTRASRGRRCSSATHDAIAPIFQSRRSSRRRSNRRARSLSRALEADRLGNGAARD
jgi:predicted nucleic acid-binding protein